VVDKKELLEIALSCCFGHCEVGVRLEEFAAKFYAEFARKTVYNTNSELLTGDTNATRRAD
jgi:hypothetical protein